MFPYLFVSVWKMLKDARKPAAVAPRHPEGPSIDLNHNAAPQPAPGHRQQQQRRMTSRQKKAYGIMFVSVLGLFLPILVLSLRSMMNLALTNNREYVAWEEFRPDHTQIQRERISNMVKYSFDHNITGVDRRHKLSLREFADVYDGKWPVIITDVVKRWRAYEWSDDYLIRNYGKEKVHVKYVEDGVESAETVTLSYFLRHQNDGSPSSWRYLQDEHFLPSRPDLKRHVGEHAYMLDDYFHLFPTAVRPWDAMLLWGTAHSRSPLHVDPYNWTGSSAVLRGHKRWKLYPPGQDTYMYTRQDQRCHFPLDCQKYNSLVDAFDPDHLVRYPKFGGARVVEFDQYAGDLLIIPSGWYHQAYNFEPTLAVSGQMMNNRNYMTVLEEVLSANPIPVHNLPSTFYSLSAGDQIRIIVSRIPRDLLDRGRAVTNEARGGGGT